MTYACGTITIGLVPAPLACPVHGDGCAMLGIAELDANGEVEYVLPDDSQREKWMEVVAKQRALIHDWWWR